MVQVAMLDTDLVYRSIPLGKIENAREIKMQFEEKEKKFDPENVYKGQPNPTKI